MAMESGVLGSVRAEPRGRSPAGTSAPCAPENPLSAEELRRDTPGAQSFGISGARVLGLQGAGLGNSGFPFRLRSVPYSSPRLSGDLRRPIPLGLCARNPGSSPSPGTVRQ